MVTRFGDHCRVCTLGLSRKEEQEMAKLSPYCEHKNLAGQKAWKLS